VIPIRDDGSKKPRFEWKDFMHERAARDTVQTWFKNPIWNNSGIGIICGEISGNLEMLELEGRAASGEHIDRIVSECERRGINYLFTSLMLDGYAEWTPSGGLHFLYRITGHEVPGNTKVARRLATPEELIDKPGDKFKVLSETRGEGGYLVVAPSCGTVHATGDSWSVAAGQLGVIPTISWDERCKLHEAIHAALDEMPAPVMPAPRPALASLLPQSSERPGDDFNTRADWRDILLPHGWQVDHVQGHTTYWVRPGKDRRDGHSATTGRAADGDRLYVFSSATVFEPETPYNKFAAMALLEHNGDFSAASRALRGLGYGAAATSVPVASPSPATGLAQSDWADRAIDAAAAAKIQGTEVAVKDPNWLHQWAKPFIPADALEFVEQSYAAGGQVYGQIYEDTFKYCGELKKWKMFNGRTWQPDRKDGHEQGVVHMLMETGKQARAEDNTELAKWIRSMGRSAAPSIARWARSDPRIAVTRDEFDRHRHLITVENGIVDLDTHTFTPGHDPKLLLTKQLYVQYDKDADAPRWTQLLETLLPDQEIRSYLQRAVGHTLLGDAQERALFILHGDPGTGKSQVVRVLERMFGDYAEIANATTFNEQSKRASITNDLNDLRGKRFVSVAELDENERLNEALVKRLTGGDTAKSRGLYQENSSWDVEFSLWMVTNFLPKLSSDDAAMWNRVKPIKFPVVVKGQGEEVKKIGEKIFAEESAGILNWMLEGVRMYQEHGLDDLPQITEAVATYRREVDTVAQFMEAAAESDIVKVGADERIPARNLHGIYQQWCTNNSIRWLGERRFAQRMESLGFERKRANTGTVWLGVGTGSYGMLGTMAMRQ
jgi:putative DNA primase/helicase